ncbi:Crp/Fnr family transcriptional regulator [Sporolactobacillus laevolacticus]|uniref:Cyclic nucleotide-binding protein n=1 Tax=Sporolactobacillus laevolacticus DSM 442 TaxID=1395513 RepID=V6J0N8_9BACL|nr:Crp/Fnr family transcriptional regulator [Sporolactobacillus laevolacticus]EST10324.1 cyclic nucleotide-binding protein [Sporolactobacillus laevolacticus DSM 442]
MKTKDYDFMIDVLEQITHIKCSEEDRANVMETFTPLKLNKNEFFLRDGDLPSKLAFNVSGALRCFYIDKNGNDSTKNIFFEGAVLGYSALISNQKVPYYIETLETCRLLTIDYTSLERMIKENTTWLKIIKELQDQAIIYKERRERSFLLDDATQRYIHLIREFPNIEKRIKQKHIASYLGVSPVSLSRIRNKLNHLQM